MTTHRSLAWRLLRAVATLHVVAIFAQPVFAGRFLIGDYDMLGLHRLGADLVSYLGLAQLVLAAAGWWRLGVRWPFLAGLALVAGETAQYSAGMAGALDLHIPLGVALMTLATGTLVGLWAGAR